MPKRSPILILVLIAVPIVAPAQPLETRSEPKAEKRPHVRELHGERFVDDYFWMRNKKDPKVIEHLTAENSYADAYMASKKPFIDQLYKEIVGRIKETDVEVPVFKDGYYYYTRTQKGKQYPYYCRRKGSMSAKEQVYLDVNALAKGKKFMSVGAMAVSPNGRFLAYATDETGYREYQSAFKDLATGKTLPYRFGKVGALVWANDNRTVYYTMEDDSKRDFRVYRRRLGVTKPTLIFEEPVRQYNVYIYPSKDEKYLFVMTESAETSEARYLSLDDPRAKPKLIAKRSGEHQYYPEHRNGRLYIRTNYKAKEFDIRSTTFAKLDPKHWKVVVPERKDGSISDLDMYRDHMVVSMKTGGRPGLWVRDFRTGEQHTVAFREASYSVGNQGNPEYAAGFIHIGYTSLITPYTIYRYDIRLRKMTTLKRQEVKGYDASKYETRFVWAPARDGVKVPISVAFKKGTPLDGSAPLLLNAYGAYGASSFPSFSASDVSLLDRGVIVAEAHIRGGGEMGEKWHDAGKMANKATTFFDLIDCADWLVANGYTSHARMAISGGSAGGLTMGAVLNFRPDICKVAMVYVPFVDVVNTMLDESIPLTTQEFIEWGNPKIKEQYDWIRQYSPYDNVGAMAYPAMLVRTSLNDSQVPYWEPAKWVARIRELRTSDTPILFRTNLAGGHGGASGRYDRFKDTAYDFAFLLSMLGIER